MQDDRYSAVVDDHGKWSVVDRKTNMPAVVRKRILTGLAEDEASDAANLLRIADRIRTPEPNPAARPATVLNPFLLPIR